MSGDDPAAFSVIASVRSDLDEMPAKIATSGLAATALSLAQGMDDPRAPLSSKSMAAKSLLDVMDRLREMAPPKRAADSIDDIAEQRKRRQSAARASSASH